MEVSNEGYTTSYVFQGSVRVDPRHDAKTTASISRILHANESVKVVCNGQNQESLLTKEDSPPQFVRNISQRTPKVFDLVDVVAGGNGFSGRRNRGITPMGRVPPSPADQWRMDGDYRYHRVAGMPFVDGVFIPDGGKGPVQVDSTGHTFADFPHTDNMTIGIRPIWAGVGIPPEEGDLRKIKWPVALSLAGVDYSKPGHGLLLIVPNQGITFDLEAIRRANPEWTITSLRSVIAHAYWDNPGAYQADFFVLVDGELRKHFHEINSLNSAIPLTVPLGPNDRFLTLVTTDGGDGIAGDFTIFGDPQLELSKDRRQEQP